MHVICLLRICLISLFSLLIISARSQQADTSVTAKGKDRTWIKYLTRLNQFGAEETVRSIQKFEAGRLSIHRNNLVSQIEKTTQLAGFHLKKGIDTNEVKG